MKSAEDAQLDRDLANALGQLPDGGENIRPTHYWGDTVFLVHVLRLREATTQVQMLLNDQATRSAAWPVTRSAYELATDIHAMYELARPQQSEIKGTRWAGTWNGVGCRVAAVELLKDEYLAQQYDVLVEKGDGRTAAQQAQSHLQSILKHVKEQIGDTEQISEFQAIYDEARTEFSTKDSQQLKRVKHWFPPGDRFYILRFLLTSESLADRNYLEYRFLSRFSHGAAWLPEWPEKREGRIRLRWGHATPPESEDPRPFLVAAAKRATDIWRNMRDRGRSLREEK